MTSVDDDFTGYVGARWPSLVRTLVLLGCPIEIAPDVATIGLARCRRGWRDTAEHDDLEVVVHRAVIAAWEERRRDRWWADLRPRSDQDWPLPDMSLLDRMTPEVRTGLVLRRYASLDVGQASAIAGPDAGGPLPHAPDAPTLVNAADSIVVYAPPPSAEMVDSVAVRRRRRLLPVVGVVVVALVLGGGTWWANRDPDDAGGDRGIDAVTPQRARNTAEVEWYAGGVLHLMNRSYAIPDVRQFSALGAGAVYTDKDGRVVHLADDGTREVIGEIDDGQPLVVSESEGRAAWIHDGQLVAYDIGQGHDVGHLDLPPSISGNDPAADTRAVAFDKEHLFFQSADGYGKWLPGDPEAEETGPDALYDVSASTRLIQYDAENISFLEPLLDLQLVAPGRGGELSPDGNYALTRDPADGTVIVYDTRTGRQVDVSPPLDAMSVIDAVLTPQLSITYLAVDDDAFTQPSGSDSVPVEGQIVTCRVDKLSLGECVEPVTFVVQSDAPLLAH